jgi:hypothetical protein
MSKEVKIPFQSEFKDRMLSEQKTYTTRTKRYGRPGDWFKAFGAFFTLIEVFEVHLNFVADTCYIGEGFDSRQDFIACWNKLHPNVTFEEKRDRTVYLHRFIRSK